ncbi:MAG: hypothetical protein ACOVO1_07705 [Chitinophagaceae bacterium]
MKNILFKAIFLFTISISSLLNAQTNTTQCIREEIDGKSLPVFVIKLPQNIDYVTNLFNDTFKIDSLGIGIIEKSGFVTFEHAKLPVLSNSFLDFSYKIEPNPIDNDIIIKVYLSKGYDNFITLQNDSDIAQNLMIQLDGLGLKVARTNIDIQILLKEQELKLQKDQLTLLENDWSQLEAELLNLESRRTQKQTAIKSQQKIVLEASRILDSEKRKAMDFDKRNTLKTLQSKVNLIRK